jgi:hypothetical protein
MPSLLGQERAEFFALPVWRDSYHLNHLGTSVHVLSVFAKKPKVAALSFTETEGLASFLSKLRSSAEVLFQVFLRVFSTPSEVRWGGVFGTIQLVNKNPSRAAGK